MVPRKVGTEFMYKALQSDPSLGTLFLLKATAESNISPFNIGFQILFLGNLSAYFFPNFPPSYMLENSQTTVALHSVNGGLWAKTKGFHFQPFLNVLPLWNWILSLFFH